MAKRNQVNTAKRKITKENIFENDNHIFNLPGTSLSADKKYMDVYNIYQTEKMKSKLVDSNFDSKEYNRKENQFIVEFVKKSYRKQAVSCSVYVIFSLIIVMSLFLTQNPLSFLMIVPVILFAFFCSVQEKKIRSKTAFMEAEVANMRKES